MVHKPKSIKSVLKNLLQLRFDPQHLKLILYSLRLEDHGNYLIIVFELKTHFSSSGGIGFP